MEQKVMEAVGVWMPEVLEGEKPSDIVTGTELHKLLDSLEPAPLEGKLTKEQKDFQAILGTTKYIEKVMPRLALPNHRCSCVMSSPPPQGLRAVRSILYMAYLNRKSGITFGGGGLTTAPRLASHMFGNIVMDDGAPKQLEGTADATWHDRCSLYGVLITFFGAAIAAVTKKIGLIVDSSMGTEAIASSKATEIIEFAREVLRAIGTPCDGPTVLYTDNKANILVAHNAGSASRSRHLLRRYVSMQERVKAGDLVLGKVDDKENPSDYLTKWVSADKINRSDAYATNKSAATIASA